MTEEERQCAGGTGVPDGPKHRAFVSHVVIARSVATWQSPGKVLRYPRRGRRPRRPEINSSLDVTSILYKERPRYQSSEVIIMLAFPIFTGSEPTAASGGRKEANEWQRSTRDKGAPSPRISVWHRNRTRQCAPQTETGGATSTSAHKKEESGFLLTLLCWHYLFSRLGQAIVMPLQQSGGLLQASRTTKKRTSTLSGGGLCWHYLFSRSVTRQLSSAHVCLTSVFGMGTGGPTRQSKPTHMDGL